MLRVDQVIGTGSTDLAHLGCAHGRGKGDLLRTSADFEDDPVGIGEQGTTERGKRLGKEGGRALFPDLRDPGTPHSEAPLRDALDRLGGSTDELQRRAVALLARRPPGDEPVPFEQNRPGMRVRLEEQRNATRHVEAGPLVVEPDDLVAERLFGERAPRRSRGQRDHGVRMRMVDVRSGDERVQQRLDRRPRLTRAERRSAADSRPSSRHPSPRARGAGQARRAGDRRSPGM